MGSGQLDSLACSVTIFGSVIMQIKVPLTKMCIIYKNCWYYKLCELDSGNSQSTIRISYLNCCSGSQSKAPIIVIQNQKRELIAQSKMDANDKCLAYVTQKERDSWNTCNDLYLRYSLSRNTFLKSWRIKCRAPFNIYKENRWKS